MFAQHSCCRHCWEHDTFFELQRGNEYLHAEFGQVVLIGTPDPFDKPQYAKTLQDAADLLG